MKPTPDFREAARRLIIGLVFAALLLVPPHVSAHPADMYAQNLAVSISPGSIDLDWQILPGPFLADAVWAAADLDHDSSISASEARSWIEPFVQALVLTVESRAIAPAPVQDVRWPASVERMRTGEDRIGVSLRFEIEPPSSEAYALDLHAAHLEANSLNWFSVETGPGLWFGQPRQENGLLSVFIQRAGQELPPEALTRWNSGMPDLGGLGTAISAIASRGEQSAAGPAAPTLGNSSVTETLTSLVKTQEFSPLFLAGALLLSLALGSLHALTPGHGKALVGAYLVGSRGRTRDAVFLGGIVTITHTGSVVLLGLVTLFASHYILPALIAPWLEIISGVLVIGFGLNLLVRRGGDLVGRLRGRVRVSHGHSHDLARSPEHDSDQGRELDTHQHADGTRHTHVHATSAGLPPITFRSLLALGISGGLVPCPDAIAILLVAFAVNRIPFGMLLILSFSIGLALVLIGIGIAMVNGVRLIARNETVSQVAAYMPVVSALVVIALGGALTVSALSSLRFGAQVAQSGPSAQAAAAANGGGTRLLYIAADSTGWDQLFEKPEPGGRPRQLTFEETGITGYVVSPDGRAILYTLFNLEGGTAIWSLDADSREPRLVLDCPASECNSPRWYPDSTRVAYERLDDATEALVPRFSIWWLDLSTGSSQPLFPDPTFASYAPRFSPDGIWLGYISSADNTLVLFNLEDKRSVSIELGPQAGLPAVWDPRGQAVLYGSQDPEGGAVRMKVFDVSARETRNLGGPEGSTDYSAAWSPDGRWIAVNRNIRLGGGEISNQVWLVRPDAAEARVLLQEPGASYSSLTWSPDGRQLLYTRYVLDLASAAPGRFDIYMADSDSGETVVLVEGGDMPTLLP